MDHDQLGALMGPRQMRNCLPCKKRKIKCDRRIPCGPCALRDDGKGCTPVTATKVEDHYDMPESASAATPSRRRLSLSSYTADTSMACRDHVLTKDFRVLERNFLALQERVRTLEANLGAGVRQSTSAIPGDMTGDARGTASPHMASSPITSRRHLGDDEMVFALEDFQMSNRINALRNLGNADAKTIRVDNVENSPSNITPDHPLSFIIPTSTDYLGQALSILPDQQTCQLLVQRYFDKVEWFQRCLHYPTFIRQCRQFWADQTAPSADFVCTYLMVICLASCTIDESFSGISNALALADQLYHAAEGVLWCSRFLHRQTFESLQAISLMTIYGYGTEDGADATWALCGSAIKIAQNLGLNRLDAERPGKAWALMWSSRLQRELGRRLWWTFVALDWSHAIAHGSAYCVHPSQNVTVLPANLDDNQLDDPHAVPHPLTVYTPINMHIFRFKFAMLYREITDHMASHKSPSYSFILSMDDSIIELANSLPRHFCDPTELPADADPSLVIDSIFLNVTANTRLIRLHRSFFLRGYQDARYARSKERCVQSSQMVLGLLDLATRRAPVLLNFWLILFYAFSAAVPVCIDMLFSPTDEKRRAMHQIVETFRERSVISPAARNSLFVLERLLEAENNFRNLALDERPQKRRRSGSESGVSVSVGEKDELLKTTIRGILQSAEFNHAQSSKPPVVNDGMEESAQPIADTTMNPSALLEMTQAPWASGNIDISGFDAVWPTFPLDLLDTLWPTQ